MRRLLLLGGVLLLATASFIGLNVASVSAQPPVTETEHSTFTEVFVDEVCDGEFAEITIAWDGVFHITDFGDGRYHVTGTLRGDFSWTQDGVTYTGHLTIWFGENSNNKGFNGTFTANGEGKGSDGSRVQIKGLSHITVNANGDLVVEFDSFTVICK